MVACSRRRTSSSLVTSATTSSGYGREKTQPPGLDSTLLPYFDLRQSIAIGRDSSHVDTASSGDHQTGPEAGQLSGDSFADARTRPRDQDHFAAVVVLHRQLLFFSTLLQAAAKH